MKHLTAFWDFIDNRLIVRRIMTLGTFAMTAQVIYWSMGYAETSDRPGGDIAMIYASVMAPLNLLMGYMFASYSKGREG